jgi:hypothetical protein
LPSNAVVEPSVADPIIGVGAIVPECEQH